MKSIDLEEARLDAVVEALQVAMRRHVQEVERRDLTPLELVALGRTAVVGVVATLREVAAERARDGGIGRLGLAGLAEAVAWPVTWFRVLVDVLMAQGVVVRVEGEARLYLAGWSGAAPDAVHMWLARHGQCFVDGARPRLTRLSKADRARAEAAFGGQATSAMVEFRGDSVRRNLCAQGVDRVVHTRNITNTQDKTLNSSIQVSPSKEGALCARLGEVLPGLMARKRAETVQRVLRATGDGEGYGEWWAKVLRVCDRAGVLGEVFDRVEVLECRGRGRFRAPGKWLVVEVAKLVHGQGMKLPPPPVVGDLHGKCA